MSILLGIAVLFGIMFAMFSDAAGGAMSPGRVPRLSLRARRDAAQPGARTELLLDGENFEPDSQVRFIASFLPDGRGGHQSEPVESTKPHLFRSSSFSDLAFAPAIPLARFAGEGEPHDIRVIATDDRGHSAEAWISGRDFYLGKVER